MMISANPSASARAGAALLVLGLIALVLAMLAVFSPAAAQNHSQKQVRGAVADKQGKVSIGIPKRPSSAKAMSRIAIKVSEDAGMPGRSSFFETNPSCITPFPVRWSSSA